MLRSMTSMTELYNVSLRDFLIQFIIPKINEYPISIIPGNLLTTILEEAKIIQRFKKDTSIDLSQTFLTKLDFSSSNCSDKTLENLPPTLFFLNCRSTQITKECLPNLCKLKKLKVLNIDNCNHLELNDCSELPETLLILTMSYMYPVELSGLKTMKSLQFLDIGSKVLSMNDYECLNELNNLKVLGLCNCDVTNENLFVLKDLCKLERLDISVNDKIENNKEYTVEKMLPFFVRSFPSLKVLNVSYTKLSSYFIGVLLRKMHLEAIGYFNSRNCDDLYKENELINKVKREEYDKYINLNDEERKKYLITVESSSFSSNEISENSACEQMEVIEGNFSFKKFLLSKRNFKGTRVFLRKMNFFSDFDEALTFLSLPETPFGSIPTSFGFVSFAMIDSNSLIGKIDKSVSISNFLDHKSMILEKFRWVEGNVFFLQSTMLSCFFKMLKEKIGYNDSFILSIIKMLYYIREWLIRPENEKLIKDEGLTKYVTYLLVFVSHVSFKSSTHKKLFKRCSAITNLLFRSADCNNTKNIFKAITLILELAKKNKDDNDFLRVSIDALTNLTIDQRSLSSIHEIIGDEVLQFIYELLKEKGEDEQTVYRCCGFLWNLSEKDSIRKIVFKNCVFHLSKMLEEKQTFTTSYFIGMVFANCSLNKEVMMVKENVKVIENNLSLLLQMDYTQQTSGCWGAYFPLFDLFDSKSVVVVEFASWLVCSETFRVDERERLVKEMINYQFEWRKMKDKYLEIALENLKKNEELKVILFENFKM